MNECLNTEAVLEYSRSPSAQTPPSNMSTPINFHHSRTFPAAIAGQGDYFHYDINTKEAVLVFSPDSNVELPTVLKVPVAWHYTKGFTIQV